MSRLTKIERDIAVGLLTAAPHMDTSSSTTTRLVGNTGGRAAPLGAAGVEGLMGGLGLGLTAAAGYLGALAGPGVLVGSLFGAYGGRMTGKMMDENARETEDLAFLEPFE